MSFDDKRPLLHWLFDGKDDQGRNYGIYITKRGRGPRKKIDDFLCSRITGIRALKSGDTDYQSWDEDDQEYKANSRAEMRRGALLAGRPDRSSPWSSLKPPHL